MGGKTSKLDPILLAVGLQNEKIQSVDQYALQGWLDSEPYFNQNESKKNEFQAHFGLKEELTREGSASVSRADLEKFLLSWPGADLNKLIQSINDSQKQHKPRQPEGKRKSRLGRESSSRKGSNSSNDGTSTSTSTASTSSTGSDGKDHDSHSDGGTGEPASLHYDRVSSVPATPAKESLPPMRGAVEEDGSGVVDRKRREGVPISATAATQSDLMDPHWINPRTATPEDFRKRGGFNRAHTWTPGIPLTPILAQRLRRRLSITNDPDKPYVLDGIPDTSSPRKEKLEKKAAASIISQFATYSHVGYIPFNQDKVNQDRCIAVIPFAGHHTRGLFGVFDGHGSAGHEVSTFLASSFPANLTHQIEELNKRIEKRAKSASPEGEIDVKDYIGKAFYRTFEDLKTGSGIDCAFSGSTAIICYIQDDVLFACNVGDSRAVLAISSEEDKKFVAVPLSSDQTPQREDEKKRIIKAGGRIEPCQDEDGSWIGPLRVWLKTRPVPGLAMTRSFGDLIAAPVGVTPIPEIYERKIEKTDCYIIIASDGVWEFISNQEAVDIVASADGDAQKACDLLYAEADARWKKEEEVIDDISALVLYLHGGPHKGDEAGDSPGTPLVSHSSLESRRRSSQTD